MLRHTSEKWKDHFLTSIQPLELVVNVVFLWWRVLFFLKENADFHYLFLCDPALPSRMFSPFTFGTLSQGHGIWREHLVIMRSMLQSRRSQGKIGCNVVYKPILNMLDTEQVGY